MADRAAPDGALTGCHLDPVDWAILWAAGVVTVIMTEGCASRIARRRPMGGEPVVLFIGRDDFPEAVTGHPRSLVTAGAVAERYLPH
jgi:hypothetical protein